jgi:hypothetical protein
LLTHIVSAALSGWAVWKITAVLPDLAKSGDWKLLGLGLLALAVVAAPTSLASVGPVLREIGGLLKR